MKSTVSIQPINLKLHPKRYWRRKLVNSVVGRLVKDIWFVIKTILHVREWRLLAVAGIGLGLGFSLTAFQPQFKVQALDDQHLEIGLVQPQKFALENYLAWEVGSEDFNARFYNGVGLESSKATAIILPSKKVVLDLGHLLIVQASNNGIYYYRLLGIRQVETAEIGGILNTYNRKRLVLIVPKSNQTSVLFEFAPDTGR